MSTYHKYTIYIDSGSTGNLRKPEVWLGEVDTLEEVRTSIEAFKEARGTLISHSILNIYAKDRNEKVVAVAWGTPEKEQGELDKCREHDEEDRKKLNEKVTTLYRKLESKKKRKRNPFTIT